MTFPQFLKMPYLSIILLLRSNPIVACCGLIVNIRSPAIVVIITQAHSCCTVTLCSSSKTKDVILGFLNNPIPVVAGKQNLSTTSRTQLQFNHEKLSTK